MQKSRAEDLADAILNILKEAEADDRDTIAVAFWLLSNVVNSSIVVGDHECAKAHLDMCWGKFMNTRLEP